MTARRTRRLDESTVIDLVRKGDYVGLAELTGIAVDEIEHLFDGMGGDDYDALDHYDDDDDDDEDRLFGELDDDGEDKDGDHDEDEDGD